MQGKQLGPEPWVSAYSRDRDVPGSVRGSGAEERMAWAVPGGLGDACGAEKH